ncbi:MAG: hypothetical protein U9N52_03480 [Campylobacterota bacterium]|nr:hypothetical protein [Campylobacterota bacterium]
MRFLVSFLVLIGILFADEYSDFNQYYQEQNYASYKKACQIGKRIFSNNEKDEKLLAIIGMACLKADYIDTLGMIQSRLLYTKEARASASIFSSLVLQKRLLQQFLHDDANISSFALPVIEHPLSKAFIKARDGAFKLESQSPKRITFEDEGIHYSVYIDASKKGKMAIDMRFSDGTIQQHRYR